ncbi:MAG: DNA-binding response regulator [Chloroflexi bacterium]|nr:MAG: DNA-binding response regulator [Chloroflexota bacterium]
MDREEKIRVLLADDHSLLREAMRNCIDHEEDMEVVGEAGDGEEAVRLCSDLNPDIVIMDIVMPKLNGIEASKQIKEMNPAVAVLILTAYDDDRYILGLLEAGAAGYLLKSARGRTVVEAVRTISRGESVLHPTVIAKLLKHALRTEVSPEESRYGDLLSAREMEIMKLAARGMSNKDIAEELCLTVRTVKAHLSNIFSKLGVASRTEAILKGLREGWLSLQAE